MEDNIATGRSKRQKLDKTGRLAALQRLKNLKGSKHKYELTEVQNIYDEVDEREYSKRVLERQEDDWIEDDGGGGYVEDGREIFDDDPDDDNIIQSSANKSRTKKKIHDVSKSSIKSMLANMPAKKKLSAPKKTEDDDILGDLMEEIKSGDSKGSRAETSTKDYLKSFTTPRSQNVTPQRLPNITMPSSRKVMTNTRIQDDLEEFGLKLLPGVMETTTCSAEDTTMETIEVETLPKEEQCSNFPSDTEDINMDDFASMDFDDLKSEIPQQKEMIHLENEVVMEVPDNELEISDKWESHKENVDLSKDQVYIDNSSVPMSKNEKGESVFRFYWWDSYEDMFKQPGTVYLFGKVFIQSAKSYVSCCIAVKDIPRRIFVLPREKKYNLKKKEYSEEPVLFLDVYKEFNEKIANPNKFKSFKSRRVVRKYAFDLHDVPAESEYLEVKYSATDNKLSSDLEGETFSRIFGTNTSSLELFLLEKKVKGPCWLEIKNPQPSQVSFSWCKVEAICSNLDNLSLSTLIEPPPPMVVMSLNIRTTVISKTMQNEIIMIGCLVHNEFKIDMPAPNPGFKSHFCAFTHPHGTTWPLDLKRRLPNYKATQIFQHESERSLLAFFLAKLSNIDPDLIVGHDLYGFTLDTLLHRIDHHKVPHWSRLGRIKRAIIPQTKGKQSDKNIICGRLVCDINISARELIRARSYDLDTLCKQILHIKDDARQNYTSEEILDMFGSSVNIFTLINATMQDSNFILRLMYELNVLPLALQITAIAGNVMSKTLLGGRAELNEYLLLHAFTEKEYIVPDKTYSKKKVQIIEDMDLVPTTGKKKPQYAGGLVLEPKKGFYDKFILLMDFNSLYPSIIQEYNICFTTVTRFDDDDVEPEVPNSNLPAGILPIEIRKLVESRRTVKELMKAPDLSTDVRMQYNIRQMALKLTANSMYGCLGFSMSRFYAKPLAALVTSKGREILMNTRDVVQKMNFEVIYGDTDSIMINTNCLDYDQVFKIGHKIKQEINKLYKHVELEVDGVFKYMLLLKKKKYAAVTLTKKPNGELVASQEHKGLDIVRRDWSQISAEVGKYVLNQILSDLNPDERIGNIREHLEKVATDLKSKVIPIPLLSIAKQLAKNPEEYADKKTLPHLQVAIRMNSRGGKKLKAGDTVPYVICDDGTNLPATQRAYHVDEMKSNENLQIDVNYYLSQQIHPVVSRLCEPIDGTDPAFIADCLGLDPSGYKKIIQRNNDEHEPADEGDYTLINDIQSFKNCEKFSFQCMNENCKTTITMDGPMHDNSLALTRCRNPACKTSPLEYLPCIQNTLQKTVRGYIHRLYQNWMICEDPGCPNKTRRTPMFFINSFPVCTMCKRGLMYREYRNSDLYYQLKYFEYIFTIKKTKTPISSLAENAYKTLQNQMSTVLSQSAYRMLDFSKIFKFALKDDKGRKGQVEKTKITSSQRAYLDSQKKWQAL